MVLDIFTVSAIVTIVVGVITIYTFVRTKRAQSQQEPKPPESTEPTPHARDPNLQHVEARLFYPNKVIRENRDPKKNNPHNKIILLKDLKKAYYVGSYAWNLIITNKIEWFSENDQDIDVWCSNEGYNLFKEEADANKLMEPYFFAEIRNKKSTYRRGEPVLFRTIYRGELTNGFFDNEIVAPQGQVFPNGIPSAWRWAPDTLDNSHPTTRGNLDGLVNTYSSDWSWIIPRNAPVGEYIVYMRVYNHLRVGERPIVAQQEDGFIVRAARANPTLTLDIKNGPVGTVVTASGSGFTAEGTVNMININGDSCTFINTILIDIVGKFTGAFVIPSVENLGIYEITVTDSNGLEAKCDFLITGLAEIEVTPTYGSPGATIIVTGSNFTQIAGTKVTVTMNSNPTVTLVVVDTDADGSFETTFVSPAVSFQTYIVTATDDYFIEADDTFKVGLIALIIDPVSGEAGTKIAITGIGFAPGFYNLMFGDILYEEVSIVRGDEALSDLFYVPNVNPGIYDVTVIDADKNELTVQFTVTEISIIEELGVVLPPGSPFRGIIELAKVLGSVTEYVKICDPWVDIETLEALLSVPKGISIYLLTGESGISKRFQSACSAFQAEHSSFEVRTVQGLHDRFILTKNRGWLLGSSIKDFGKKFSAFTPLLNKDVMVTESIYSDLWGKAQPI